MSSSADENMKREVHSDRRNIDIAKHKTENVIYARKDIQTSKQNFFKLVQKEAKVIRGTKNKCKEQTHPQPGLMSLQFFEWMAS